MSKIAQGLRETPVDPRNFPLGAIVGHVANPDALPKEYTVGKPLVIKDQGMTDMCSAYALTAVSEDQEGVILDPRFTFGVTKKISGDPDEWGANLLDACKSTLAKNQGGFLPIADDNKIIVTTPASDEMRESSANGKILTKEALWVAKKYAKKSFFEVDGNFDFFGNCKSALWQLRSEERSILTGCRWYEGWTDAKGGIIDAIDPSERWYGHAVKCFGWDGDYLVFQLSNGEEIGEKGIFKIRHDIVNEAFRFGAFTFLDLPRENAEYEIKKKDKKGLARWQNALRFWFTSIIS